VLRRSGAGEQQPDLAGACAQPANDITPVVDAVIIRPDPVPTAAS
jgi:hypothetical protein